MRDDLYLMRWSCIKPAGDVDAHVCFVEQSRIILFWNRGDCVACSGQAIVVFIRESGPGGAVYSPAVDGQTLTFAASDGAFTDQEAGSTWDI